MWAPLRDDADHQFYTPVGISAEYAHPVEDFLNQAAFIAGPFIMGSHIFTLYMWLLLRLWETGTTRRLCV
jgi:4-alpha-methyl-delta7-sterol-4alpha-methyl oxidase